MLEIVLTSSESDQYSSAPKEISKFPLMYMTGQSFVAPAPSGPRKSGAFNFSIFKALLKALHCRAKFVVKSPLKAGKLHFKKVYEFF